MAKSFSNFNEVQYTLLIWLTTTLAFLVTLLRLVVRFQHIRSLRWDDGFAIISTICLLMMAVLCHLQRDPLFTIVSFYRQEVSPKGPTSIETLAKAVAMQAKGQFAFMVFFWTCLWCVKGSLLMFYRRLFVGVLGYMKWWWIVVGICAVTYVGSLMTNVLVCLPLSMRFSIESVNCPIEVAVLLLKIATTIDVVTDVLVMILPIRLLFGLQITIKQKIGIGSIFSLGLLIIIFALVRMLSCAPLVAARSPVAIMTVSLWSMMEGAVAVIVASLPPLKSLVSQRKGRSYGYGYNSSKPSSRIGKSTNPASTTGARGPIPLYNINNNVQNNIRGGYDSDEALNGSADQKMGISRTQEVKVTFHPERRLGNDDASIESFRHV